MGSATSGYASFAADVANSGDGRQADYLTAQAEQNEAAAKKIRAQIKGLERTLASVETEAKAARSALRDSREG